jgi:hypothetical protein
MSKQPSTNSVPTLNPFATRLTEEELSEAVSSFYGTKTLVVDRPFAEALLSYNTANRGLSRRKIERLATQMKNGEFENTGEPVIISAEGILNDGQHRLFAVVESEATVDMDIRFGIARKAFSKTDTGSSRTGGDVLSIRGVTGGSSIAPAVRLLILYKRGLPEAIREFVSNAEVDESFGRWKGIEAVGRQMAGYNFPKGVRSTPLLATAYLGSRSPGKDRLAAWLETLATGLAAGKTDPAYILRERLMRGVDAPVGTRESLVERFALMILSWNAYSEGLGIGQRDLRWSASGKTAKPFPKVEGARL